MARGLPDHVDDTKSTFYRLRPEEGGTMVSCDGLSPPDSDYFVAMNSDMFDSSICYQEITITWGGKTATAQILDECPTCPTYGQIDMSEGLMSFFDPTLDIGELHGVSWRLGGGGDSKAKAKQGNDNTEAAPSSEAKPAPQFTPPPVLAVQAAAESHSSEEAEPSDSAVNNDDGDTSDNWGADSSSEERPTPTHDADHGRPTEPPTSASGDWGHGGGSQSRSHSGSHSHPHHSGSNRHRQGHWRSADNEQDGYVR